MDFRFRANTNIKFNFQSDLLFSRENWLCECNKAIQSQRHLKICEQYSDLQQKYSLKNDLSIVDYFDEILRRKECKYS